MKTVFTVSWLAVLASGIAFVFWHSEWKYSQPTPKPANYSPLPVGETARFAADWFDNDKRPVFLHFYNPDCPCSKFNLPHFKELVKRNSFNTRFAIVLMTERSYTDEEIQSKFQLTIPVIRDSSLAASCGVYSTPQAVIIDKYARIHYRGNYNKARYCSDESTSYAKIALFQLHSNQRQEILDHYAVTAYGCQLPNCSK